jgi:hypothetical protein
MRTTLISIFFTATLFAQLPGGPGGSGGNGDGIWRRNAAYGESQTFDTCLGHQTNTGDYHYHVNPLCLRAQLNDNVVVLRNSRIGPVYHEKSSGWTHSPILGWAQDGYPIYGPYEYTNPTDAMSPIKRIVSSFQLRSITARTLLPTWSLPNHSGVSQQLTSSQFGPAATTQYPRVSMSRPWRPVATRAVYQDKNRNVLAGAWSPLNERIVFSIGTFAAFFGGFRTLSLKPADRAEDGAQMYSSHKHQGWRGWASGEVRLGSGGGPAVRQ